MGSKVVLCYNEYEIYKYNIMEFSDNDFCISINTKLDESFDKLINGNNDLGDSINSSIEYLKNSGLNYAEEEIDFLENCLLNKDTLLKNSVYVEFHFPIDKVAKYLKKNPEVKNKNIIICDDCNLSYENLKKYEDIFGEFSDNLFFKLVGNKKLISYSDCISTYKILEEIVYNVKKYNFSPLENIMYIYDLVRDKVYNKESIGEDGCVSRDLSSSLLGNKIVCLGYARIFNALLEKLEIKSKEIYLYGEISGHARNEVYIKDDKYGVNGVYYFDATWDSKKCENDNSFLASYRFFAMTKGEMDSIDNGKRIQQNFPYFSNNFVNEIKNLIEESGIDSVSDEYVKSINHMAGMVNSKYLIDMLSYFNINSPFYGKRDLEEIVSELNEIVSYFDNSLSADTLLMALYNVRKIQYYYDSDRYPFSLEDFYKTVVASNWNFEDNAEYLLLDFLFGEKVKRNKKKQMICYSDKINLNQDINRIKLVKTLKKVCEKK